MEKQVCNVLKRSIDHLTSLVKQGGKEPYDQTHTIDKILFQWHKSALNKPENWIQS